MIQNSLRKITSKLIPVTILSVLIFSSCVSNKKYTYFSDIRDTTLASAPRLTPHIHRNDILSIAVSSLNQDASTIFNPPNAQGVPGVTNATSTQSQIGGYLVSEEGTIQFPVLGTIRAEGLSTKELSDTIGHILTDKKLLVEPIVTVRYLNFRVTVLGEVGHPMVIAVPNQRISLLEALGIAGDLTFYGRRDNILIIHEELGKKTIRIVDIRSKKFLSSPDYYLKSNDVVYVEQNINKLRSQSNYRTILPIVFSGLSLVVLTFGYVYHR